MKAAAAPATTIQFEDIRIIPAPISRYRPAPSQITCCLKPFMVQMIRQAILTYPALPTRLCREP
jgi:hypothetical protein